MEHKSNRFVSLRSKKTQGENFLPGKLISDAGTPGMISNPGFLSGEHVLKIVEVDVTYKHF
jgi:16S rRNA C1402 (ribose-2'-O) methylase RsmI